VPRSVDDVLDSGDQVVPVDDDASQWLPPKQGVDCQCAADQVMIKRMYGPHATRQTPGRACIRQETFAESTGILATNIDAVGDGLLVRSL
jgi:hypothetical protein